MMDTARLRRRAEAAQYLGDKVLSMRTHGDTLRCIARDLLRAAECIEAQNEIIRQLGGNYEKANS